MEARWKHERPALQYKLWQHHRSGYDTGILQSMLKNFITLGLVGHVHCKTAQYWLHCLQLVQNTGTHEVLMLFTGCGAFVILDSLVQENYWLCVAVKCHSPKNQVVHLPTSGLFFNSVIINLNGNIISSKEHEHHSRHSSKVILSMHGGSRRSRRRRSWLQSSWLQSSWAWTNRRSVCGYIIFATHS